MKAMRTRGMWGVLAVGLVLGGCQTGTLPDPNDAGAMGGVMKAAVLRRNLAYANQVLEHRAEVGEISSKKRTELLKRYAAEMVENIHVDKIPDDQAWEYGDIFKTAELWDKAKVAYEKAIIKPKTEDRRINDTLRLALAEAHLGNVPRAIELARSVMDANDEQTAPILPAVLLEIVPAAEGKGSDSELATLLEDAIEAHQRTVVNPGTEAGKMFFMAKPTHIRDAYRKAILLYMRAGQPEEADRVKREADQVLRKFGRV